MKLWSIFSLALSRSYFRCVTVPCEGVTMTGHSRAAQGVPAPDPLVLILQLPETGIQIPRGLQAASEFLSVPASLNLQ